MWDDAEMFRRWMVGSESIKYYLDYFWLAVPNTWGNVQRARVKNPFHFLKGRRSSLRQEEVFNPLLILPPAFSVLIDLKAKPSRHEDFQRMAWSSEACAVQEEECLRYDILVGWEEHEQYVYSIYAVFQSESGFRLHAAQGYSLLGTRARPCCAKDPVISTFIRNSIAM
jgi:hypothetical protein